LAVKEMKTEKIHWVFGPCDTLDNLVDTQSIFEANCMKCMDAYLKERIKDWKYQHGEVVKTQARIAELKKENK